MSRRICIASPKGGVGKTTTALNLAVALAELGHRVLLVDLDPQGGIGHSLARKDAALLGLADLLLDRIPPLQAVLPTRLPNLALLPRGVLSPLDMLIFEQELGRAGRLRGILEGAEGAGTAITILDTPSGLGTITRAALGVADWLLLPFQTESLALRSVTQIFKLVEQIRATDNPFLRLLGILPSMVDKRNGLSMDILEKVWMGLPGVLDALIPRQERFAEASLKGLPLAFLPGPPSPEAVRFSMLATEILGVMERGNGTGASHEAQPARSLL